MTLVEVRVGELPSVLSAFAEDAEAVERVSNER
jgi:hypothetical protein